MGKRAAPSVSGLVVFLCAGVHIEIFKNLNNLLNQHFGVKLRKTEKTRVKMSISEM